MSQICRPHREHDKTVGVISFTAIVLFISMASAQQTLPDAPSATKTGKSNVARTSEGNWPRIFKNETDTFSIYPPQVDRWQGNLVELYCAVELKQGTDSSPKYGVVSLQARTEVDKINRLVTLDNMKVTSVKFPSAAEKEAELQALLEKKLPGATKTISLDRLESALEADSESMKGVEVKNDPPKVIISTKPSVLVLIDGPPQLREVPDSRLQRVINTRSIILFENDKKLYYLRVQDWWLQSKELEGPWQYAKKLPDDMKKAEEYLVNQNLAQNPEGEKPPQQQQQPSLKEAGKKAQIPVVHVVFGPAELIEVNGDPKYNPISGTGLQYVINTNGNIFQLDGQYYILISGRWFKGASLDGPWTFVDAKNMPADFAKIPKDNPKATVLASVPGTPESKDALIANSIPQTATITRSEAKLTA